MVAAHALAGIIAGGGLAWEPGQGGKCREHVLLLCTRAEPRKPGGRGLEEGPGSEDRQTDRQAGQQRHTDTERKTEVTGRDTQRHRQRSTDRPRGRQTDPDRDAETYRDSQAETDRDSCTQRQTDRQTEETARESLPAPGSHPAPQVLAYPTLGVLGYPLHPLHAVKIYLIFSSQPAGFLLRPRSDQRRSPAVLCPPPSSLSHPLVPWYQPGVG